MYNDEYNRGYQDASRAHNEAFIRAQREKERQEARERFKKNIAELDWEAMGSERLRRYKEQQFGFVGPYQDIIPRIFVTVVIIGIILFLYMIF